MAAPEKLTIDTPEQIALEFPLASLGSRFLAAGVDTLLQGVAMTALLVVGFMTLLSDAVSSAASPWIVGGLLLMGFSIYYGYFVLFEVLWQGQTPGKRMIGLRTIGASGRPMTPYDSILRNVLRIVDQLPGFYAIGIVSIFVTEKGQRLGDLAAGTVVIHERPIEQQRFPDMSAAPGIHYGAGRLTADEIALIETFLRRRREIEGVRQLRAGQIAARIRTRLGIHSTEPDESFLEQVAAEYRAMGRYH